MSVNPSGNRRLARALVKQMVSYGGDTTRRDATPILVMGLSARLSFTFAYYTMSAVRVLGIRRSLVV